MFSHTKKIFIFLSLIFYASLHTYPISFRRFVMTDENYNLKKTVDLIGDTHIAIREVVKNPSPYQQEFLSDIEKNFFSTAERTLLIALRQLNKQQTPIDLLWEVTKGTPTIYPQTFIKPFIVYGGFILQENFKNNKGSIQFHNVDTFRAMMGPNGLYFHALFLYLANATIKANFQIRDFKESLEKIIKKASDDAKSLSPSLYEYEEIKKSYSGIEDTLKKIIEKIIDPALEKNPNMLFDEFAKNLTPNQRVDLDEIIVKKLPEEEMLIKIYSSDAPHIILYAGESHTKRIRNALEDPYFLEIEISSIFLNIITVPLSHRAWLLLLQSPQESFKKFKQRKEEAWIFNEEDRGTKFYTFFSILETMESDDKKQEDFINHQLEPFLMESTSRGYFNFIEARRNNNNETLLFYAVRKNLYKIVNFLVDHGARINIRNNNNDTPLHFAAKLPNSEIFLFLLDRGALNYEDKAGHVPLFYAANLKNWIRSEWENIYAKVKKLNEITKKQEFKKAKIKRKATEITTTTTTTQTMEPEQKILR